MFWYSQVEAIDFSLCTVAIYCEKTYSGPLLPVALNDNQGRMKLHKVLMYFKEVQAPIIPPGQWG